MANAIVQAIINGARSRGLDPAAVLAVASQEGLSGRIGDNGHAYGPFQLNNAGGVITGSHPGSYSQQIQNWASSPEGINFALDRIGGVAKGLHGHEAINAIVTRFERPLNPGREIMGAAGAYGRYAGVGGNAASTQTPAFGPAPTGTVAPQQGMSPGLAGLFNAGNKLFDLPAINFPTSAPSRQVVGQPQAGSVLPSSPAPTLPKTSLKGSRAVNVAAKALGIPYQWGGESTKGFDCSGLLQYAWKRAGVNIPRTTYDQWQQGAPVDAQNLEPGDAVFFKGSDSKTVNGRVLPGHVGIYIGNGRFIEAPRTGLNVRISSLRGRADFMGGRRYS